MSGDRTGEARSVIPKLTMFGCKTHNTEHDFHFGLGEGGRNRWRCSYCSAADVWRGGWGYFGDLECRKCGWATMQAVHCPRAECLAAMIAEFGDDPKRRGQVRSTGRKPGKTKD